MRLALLHDLPEGGALNATYEVVKRLSETNEIDCYELERKRSTSFESVCNEVYRYKTKSPYVRVKNDIYALFGERLLEKRIAREIDLKNYDYALITHTRYFQAPWILRYLKTKTIFICQEPTRAFFEDFLKPDTSLPPHKYMYEHAVRLVKKRIEVKNAKEASTIVANSKYASKKIKEAYGEPSTTITLGVDEKLFKPSKGRRKNQVMIVGKNEAQKSLPLAVKSVSRLKKKKRPALLVVSPGPTETEDLSLLAKSLKVDISFKSGIEKKDLAKEYSRSALTLATAIGEPFGLSAVESMACGTPVVAVDEGGFKETVIDGKTGFLVDREPDDIAKHMALILEKKELRDKMSKAAVKHVLENFTWDSVADRFSKLLK